MIEISSTFITRPARRGVAHRVGTASTPACAGAKLLPAAVGCDELFGLLSSPGARLVRVSPVVGGEDGMDDRPGRLDRVLRVKARRRRPWRRREGVRRAPLCSLDSSRGATLVAEELLACALDAGGECDRCVGGEPEAKVVRQAACRQGVGEELLRRRLQLDQDFGHCLGRHFPERRFHGTRPSARRRSPNARRRRSPRRSPSRLRARPGSPRTGRAQVAAAERFIALNTSGFSLCNAPKPLQSAAPSRAAQPSGRGGSRSRRVNSPPFVERTAAFHAEVLGQRDLGRWRRICGPNGSRNELAKRK